MMAAAALKPDKLEFNLVYEPDSNTVRVTATLHDE